MAFSLSDPTDNLVSAQNKISISPFERQDLQMRQIKCARFSEAVEDTTTSLKAFQTLQFKRR